MTMKTALVAGATGLIGKELVNKLTESADYGTIYLVSRKKSGIENPKIIELITDFDHLLELNVSGPVDVAFCTLGTTIKKAGSRANFKKVDYEFIVQFSRIAFNAGALQFIVVSSMGASPKSNFFYNRIKGLTEEALKTIGFNQLVILRPSLLLGKRTEERITERLSAVIMKMFSFVIPANYKAIKAEKVADNMLRLSKVPGIGIIILESGELFRN